MQLHVLSFEGPDAYSQAGGIASRVTGLTQSFANLGFDTHLWFVGDPTLPGHESSGRLTLHRWCQWISHYHPGGVYDGEEGKRADYAASLPPFLMREYLEPHLARGGHAVVMAEEWQTADAVTHLDWLLRCARRHDRVRIFWNANNTFGFDRIDWPRLSAAATITTVSRYMGHHMRDLGVEAVVIPNGLSQEEMKLPAIDAVEEFRRRFAGRIVVAKVARFDPDKRWMPALDIVGELKREGWRPLLVARGGVEPYGREVMSVAQAAGLMVVKRRNAEPGVGGLMTILDRGLEAADIVDLQFPLDPEARRLLFRASAAVLANSGHEPFGLVGLETMAVGGLACTGCSGEEYAVAGRNAVVLETPDPQEFLGHFRRLRANPLEERAMRRAGRVTARHYAWPRIIRRNIMPNLTSLAAGEP